jgi:hypothetical protein
MALSASAAQASSVAISLVPTYGEYGCPPGDLVELTALLAGQAIEALTYAIACERQRGTSWEQIADVLDEDVAEVRERYEAPVARLRRRLLESWLDPEAPARLPDGADDPAATAARLDEWLTGDARLGDTFRHHPDSEVRAHPVSTGLAVMSLAEHRRLLASAARLVAENAEDDPTGERNHRAEIGLHRRRIALLEWLLAEELNDPAMAGEVDQDALRALLDAARHRLARL